MVLALRTNEMLDRLTGNENTQRESQMNTATERRALEKSLYQKKLIFYSSCDIVSMQY